MEAPPRVFTRAVATLALLVLLAASGVLVGSTGAGVPGGAVFWLRVSRTLAAAGVGVLLGVAGALIQYSVANPLADPGLLGLTQGAMAAVALAMLVAGEPLSVGERLAVGSIGALAAYAASVALAGRLGLTGPGLVVAGIAVASTATGVGMAALVLVENLLGVPAYSLLLGTFAYATRSDALLAAVAAAVAVAVSLPLSRPLDALSYGDLEAASMGYRPGLVRVAATLTAAAAVAASIQVAGLVGFIGLIAPNAARMLYGAHPSRGLPGAAALGAAVAVAADLASRLASMTLGTGELPAGTVTSLAGGVFLAYLVARGRGRGAA